jgi:hypothetical protein
MSTGMAAARSDEVENRNGLHGLAVWALAVVIGSMISAFVGAATVNRSSPSTANASSALTQSSLNRVTFAF